MMRSLRIVRLYSIHLSLTVWLSGSTEVELRAGATLLNTLTDVMFI